MPAPIRPPMRAVAFGEVLAVLAQEQPGALEDAEMFRRSLGGAEANVAIALAARGIDVAMLTRVGDDGFGRFATGLLSRLGVDVAPVQIDPARPTGLYVKEIDGGGSSMHYYRSGSAAAAIGPEYLDLPAVAGAVAGAGLVHTTGITPAISDTAAAAQRALVQAFAGRGLCSFDLNWRPALWRGREAAGSELLAGFMRSSDIAFAGQDEAAVVFGVHTADGLRRMFPEPRWLVVKNDGGAAAAFDGDERVDVAPGRVDVVEAIGAGDAFAAGFLAGVMYGFSLRDCVVQGHDMAALALRTAGDHIGAGGVG
ncbi:sugar kinase [Microbacterium kribbense]|uniref:Sugar kinase n=1 Tax=Microbacterium kribbense TaxID=433645 RepID=A0ABP7GIV8_9MICO